MIKCTIKELRQKTKEILDMTDLGEEVLITYRGQEKALVSGIERVKKKSRIGFGMWADRDDLGDAGSYVQGLRKGRFS